MDIHALRQQFPVLNNILFLNHAGVSPISEKVADAMAAHILDACEYAGTHEDKWLETCAKTRESFARLIHVPSTDVAIMKNTTEPINVIANGYPMSTGDNVIITNVEYPANVYPWLNQTSRGIEIRKVKERNAKIELDDIIAKVDSKTKIISVSFVEFASGYRNDLKSIGKFCREKNILFVVDAIQGVGILELDATECKIDALTIGMHKWMLGPCGVGLFYCRKDILDKIKLCYVGADSVIDSDKYLNYNLNLLPDARRLEYAMLNFPGIAGAYAAFEMVESYGIKNIQSRIKMLTDFLITKLQDKGYLIYSPREKGEWSGIVSCFSNKYPAQELHKRLKENKIFASVRAERLRLSLHYYNNEADLQKVIDILPTH